MIIQESPYISITHRCNENLIEVQWKPASLQMDAEAYQATLLDLITIAEQHQPKKWLGDTRLFFFQISPELQHWTVQKFNIPLKNIGVEKMAILVTQKIHETFVQYSQQDYSSFPSSETQYEYFKDKEEAMDWLTTSQN
ncbi:STAS/SEC14 domain-containing protein [Algivirga pacifica]|uniref:STAS/SEC14 domain-containing protein n=1 Tax=Algivirga pacifica TaxID=1162670 RepID=A0ABP9DFQ3_9BACT